MRRIQNVRAEKAVREATEYQLWRFPWDDSSVIHVMPHPPQDHIHTKIFNRFTQALEQPTSYIALPWIHLPSLPDPLQWKIVMKGRFTNIRHDDIAILTAALQTRSLYGPTQTHYTEARAEFQRMFWDSDEIFTIEGWLSNPERCIRFLIGIGGKFGTKFTKRKGIAFQWESISVFANVIFEYFYLLYDINRWPLTKLRKYNRNFELIWEKEIDEWERGMILHDGSILMTLGRKQAGKFKIGRYDDEGGNIYTKYPSEDDWPYSGIIETIDSDLLTPIGWEGKFFLGKFSYEYERIGTCEIHTDPYGSPNLWMGGENIPVDRYIAWDAGTSGFIAMKPFCEKDVSWWKEIPGGIHWNQFAVTSYEIVNSQLRGTPEPVRYIFFFMDFEGNIIREIELPPDHPISRGRIWQIEATAADTLYILHSSWDYTYWKIFETDLNIEIIRVLELSGQETGFIGTLITETIIP